MHDAIAGAFCDCGFDYELLFVDDGSRDGTFDALKKICQSSPQNVRALRFSRNFGKESAIYAGLCHATGDYVCIIDADLQQPPALALSMLRMLEATPDCDCVAAYQAQRQEKKHLVFLKKSFYALINRVTDIEFFPGASDFRVMRRAMVDAICAMGEHNRFSKGIFSWVGFQTHYVPYTANPRHAGETKFSTWKLLRYAFEGIVSFTTMPLRLAAVTGALSAAAAFLYGAVVVVQKLFFDIVVKGYATLVVLILFLGGLQLLGLGVIGEYLAKTYVESKRRPIYIIRETRQSEPPAP
jgi:glycosyltransferase involved in cell wall biosynthesis